MKKLILLFLVEHTKFTPKCIAPLHLMIVPRHAMLNRHWGTLMHPSTAHVVQGRRMWLNVVCALETLCALRTCESSACRRPVQRRVLGPSNKAKVRSHFMKLITMKPTKNNPAIAHIDTHTFITTPSTRSQYRRRTNQHRGIILVLTLMRTTPWS